MKWLKRILLVIVLVPLLAFLGIQAVPVDRTNPPFDPAEALTAPPEVMALLRNSCYDCHSNETRWPWYAKVAPVSWWLADHVEHGRQHLNFSTWGQNSLEEQMDFLFAAAGEVEEHEMPLESYLWIHKDAVLSAEQAKVLIAWADATAARNEERLSTQP